MPGGDRTGPTDMGPMSGRAAGFCAGYGTPGYMNAGGRGFGMGFGRGGGFGGGGRGWRNRFYATGLPGWMRGGWGGAMPSEPAPAQELAMLKDQAEYFEGALAELKKRMEEIQVEKIKE